jgi:hypothetical protein
MVTGEAVPTGAATVVQVYRNLHRSRAAGRPVYSLRDRATRRVVGHAEEVVLADVSLVVRESGRQRVLAERRKNVHAWAEGRLCAAAPVGDGVPVTYNPYRGPSFTVVGTGEAVSRADFVVLGAAVTAWRPTT